jgi:hypothetical protein
VEVVKKYHPIDERITRVIRFAQGNLKQIFGSIDEDYESEQKIVVNFLRAAASGSGIKISNAIDELYKKRDKNHIIEILNLLLVWFQDVIHTGNSLQTISFDLQTELQNFSKAYVRSEFDKIITDIEDTISAIKRNAYAPLMLTTLALRINESLIKNKN